MKVEAGSKVAVFGLGGVGLSVVMALKEAGCARIIGVDTNPAKEALGRKFGITHFVNPKDIAPEDTLEGTVWQTNGGGLDYTFECIGSTKVMRSALECLHDGWGKACIIGVAPPGQEISVKPLQLVCGKSWTGSAFGGTRGRTQLPKYVDAYLEKRPPFVDEFVTVTLPHTEINEAYVVTLFVVNDLFYFVTARSFLRRQGLCIPTGQGCELVGCRMSEYVGARRTGFI
jgi:S-(hydroxymethyl)glutathione dehydrogenase/alcohol dehydrogenase